jgi:hypothetical protein
MEVRANQQNKHRFTRRDKRLALLGDDAWSSCTAHAQGAIDPHLGGHALFDGLGASPLARQKAYRGPFRKSPDADFADALRAATNGGWALGCERGAARGRDLAISTL